MHEEKSFAMSPSRRMATGLSLIGLLIIEIVKFQIGTPCGKDLKLSFGT